jgi:hypothetical protein
MTESVPLIFFYPPRHLTTAVFDIRALYRREQELGRICTEAEFINVQFL